MIRRSGKIPLRRLQLNRTLNDEEEVSTEAILGRRPNKGKGLETQVMVWPFG